MDWSVTDERLQRLVEIFSVHGNSERLGDKDNFLLVFSGGHFVQDALNMGYKLGIMSSSDCHNGHPGLSGLYDYPGYDPQLDLNKFKPFCGHDVRGRRTDADKMRGSLVAVFAPELDRKAIYRALYNRACYATTGRRIILHFEINGSPMGSIIPLSPSRKIKVKVVGTQKITALEVFRNDEIIKRIKPFAEKTECSFLDKEKIPAGTFYYVRVIEGAGDKAWTSPIWCVNSKTSKYKPIN